LVVLPGGFVTSDRYVGYHWLDVLQQQLCWAHLVRQLTEISERPGAPGKLGARLVDIAGKVFHVHREHTPALASADHPEHPALIALRGATPTAAQDLPRAARARRTRPPPQDRPLLRRTARGTRRAVDVLRGARPEPDKQ
jgi:hypothetical protein